MKIYSLEEKNRDFFISGRRFQSGALFFARGSSLPIDQTTNNPPEGGGGSPPLMEIKAAVAQLVQED